MSGNFFFTDFNDRINIFIGSYNSNMYGLLTKAFAKNPRKGYFYNGIRRGMESTDVPV